MIRLLRIIGIRKVLIIRLREVIWMLIIIIRLREEVLLHPGMIGVLWVVRRMKVVKGLIEKLIWA